MRLALANTPKAPGGRETARLREDAGAAERAGQTNRAIELLEELVGRTPEDRATLRRLAALLVRAGRAREANTHYRRLAESYEHAGLHTKAIAAWKQVVRNEPHFAGAHVKLGELYSEQGLRADARKHYESALVIYRGTARKREAAHIEERMAELDELSDPGQRLPIDTPEPGAGQAIGVSGSQLGASGRFVAEENADPLAPDDADFLGERLVQARRARARELYTEIYGEDAGFRDVAEKLRRLGDRAEPAAEEKGVVLPWRKR